MKRQIWAVVVGVALGILQGAWLPANGGNITGLELPLIWTVWLISRFRFQEAVVAAVLAGFARGTLSGLPQPYWSLAYAIITGITILLFVRIFTNRSWPGLLGLSIAAYVGLGAVDYLGRWLLSLLGAVSEPRLPDPGLAIAGLFMQLTTIIILFVLRGFISRFLPDRARR